LAALGPDAPRDAAARALAERIDLVETVPARPGHPPAEITVETPDGRRTVRRDAAPVPDAAAVRAKALDCLRHAGHGAEAAALWDRMAAALRGGSVENFLAILPEGAA
jgi:hypothetical protein